MLWAASCWRKRILEEAVSMKSYKGFVLDYWWWQTTEPVQPLGCSEKVSLALSYFSLGTALRSSKNAKWPGDKMYLCPVWTNILIKVRSSTHSRPELHKSVHAATGWGHTWTSLLTIALGPYPQHTAPLHPKTSPSAEEMGLSSTVSLPPQ